jgi:hypothetical protein
MNIRCRTVAAWLSLAISLVPAAPASAQGVDGKKYALGSFDTVVFSGTAGVRLVQGAEDSVFIEGDAETQEAVDLAVDGGVPGSVRRARGSSGAASRSRSSSRRAICGGSRSRAPPTSSLPSRCA